MKVDMKRRRWQLSLLFLVLALIAGACTSTGAEDGDDDGTTAATEAPDSGDDGTVDTTTGGASDTTTAGDDGGEAEEDTVVVALETDVSSLDAGFAAGIVDNYVLENIYDRLGTRWPQSTGGEMQPDLAESWEQSEDGLTWTFHLREGVTFHDGSEMTASDVVASVERLAQEEFVLEDIWDGVVETEIIDDYTVAFHFEEQDDFIILRANRLYIQPEEVLAEAGLEDQSDTPIGSGPYRVVEWVRDDRIVLEANEDFWRGAPPIENLIFRVIPDQAARVAALQAGEVDLVYNVSIDQARSLEEDPNITVKSATATRRVRLAIDTRREPFDDPLVRQAISYGINVQSIIDNLLDGRVERLPAALIPEEIGWNPDLEPLSYDPERAQELLAEAGYPDGFDEPVEFSVMQDSTPAYEDVATAIAADLEALGIPVETRFYVQADFNDLKLERWENPEGLGPLQLDAHSGGSTFHGFHHYTSVYTCNGNADGAFDEIPDVHSGYICIPEVDERIREMLEVYSTDPERGVQLMQEAEAILQEEAPAVFLWQNFNIYAMDADLNWEPDASSRLLMYLASWGDEPAPTPWEG